jgi:circadian clock protein KaiC
MFSSPKAAGEAIDKSPTGIAGLDQVTFGGLPAGRPTLVCGSAGCGKTLFAMTFLVNGAAQFGESGVFMSFEERTEDLATNVASLGYDVAGLVDAGKLMFDFVRVERSEIEESGEYDLEGLFVRLDHAIRSTGAKRVVLDTIEALFSGFGDSTILRAELRRLFAWLKARGVTAIITAERGEGQLTRHGIEEYVSDCVILLDNRVIDQITTRRLRVVKYRGSAHGTNEYPFLIDEGGISVLPVTSAGLDYTVSSEVVPTGVPDLDAMLGAGGFWRGSSVLVTGAPGSGKSTLSAHFLDAACKRGERAMAFVFEEAPAQIMRNMLSAGIDLRPHVDAGLLRFEAARPSLYGFEMHLTRMMRDVNDFDPQVVVLDPITSLRGDEVELQTTLLRMVDLLKARGTTAYFTSLTAGDGTITQSDSGLSSLMDSWLSLRDIEASGERNRGLYVLKARGMSHSNQIREYLITNSGVHLVDVYVGADGVLTGSARANQEAIEAAEAVARAEEVDRRQRALARKRATIGRQIAELEADLGAEEAEIAALGRQADLREQVLVGDRSAMAARRGAAE